MSRDYAAIASKLSTHGTRLERLRGVVDGLALVLQAAKLTTGRHLPADTLLL